VSSPLLISAANPGPLTGRGNNTWLLDGDEPTLIDAGIGTIEHLAAIASVLRGRPLARVLVTHGHADHASGIGPLRARWPNVDACKWPLDGESGWHPLADGDRVWAGDLDLEVIHTPGHAPDHVCFWSATTRDLFAGDLVIQGTTVMIPAGHGGNLRAYLASLERIAALNPRRILPGHGAVVDRPLDLIAEYIGHRRLRESQVRQCLSSGTLTVEAIVAAIYPDISETLRPAARQTIEAHLEKLREDEVQ
jgi:glyoxylase-like metal-dependent hydrolase (beta-lactamase superfamily II)